MMVSGIPTASGYEERIRFAEMEIVDRGANEMGLTMNAPSGHHINGWDVNVAGVRTTSVKKHLRYHTHAVSILEFPRTSSNIKCRNTSSESNRVLTRTFTWVVVTQTLFNYTSEYASSFRAKCLPRCRERMTRTDFYNRAQMTTMPALSLQTPLRDLLLRNPQKRKAVVV
jgi:hypothetical protein